jgi:hypothetical protein
MIKLILYLLEKIPYRTRFGLSISDLLKYKYNQTHPYKCLCGGKITTKSYIRYEDDISWEISCEDCGFLADED